ncbi:hypothetical protein BD779DRAFT_1465826 [Infundibulicybe gibba]|nr:hypothetical protein BD779DRAFT_1465826 [Infundibulicybe gibba]
MAIPRKKGESLDVSTRRRPVIIGVQLNLWLKVKSEHPTANSTNPPYLLTQDTDNRLGTRLPRIGGEAGQAVTSHSDEDPGENGDGPPQIAMDLGREEPQRDLAMGFRQGASNPTSNAVSSPGINPDPLQGIRPQPPTTGMYPRTTTQRTPPQCIYKDNHQSTRNTPPNPEHEGKTEPPQNSNECAENSNPQH